MLGIVIAVSHRLGERDQPEIFERRMTVRSDFAPVGLGFDDRAEGGEIAVFIDRGFVPAFAWRADEARQHEPDAVILVHHHETLTRFERLLEQHRIRVPGDLGVLAISQSLDGTKFSGLQENQHVIGAWSVELVVTRIMNHDFGIPAHPRIEMVERRWIEGGSLRRAPKAG